MFAPDQTDKETAECHKLMMHAKSAYFAEWNLSKTEIESDNFVNNFLAVQMLTLGSQYSYRKGFDISEILKEL